MGSDRNDTDSGLRFVYQVVDANAQDAIKELEDITPIWTSESYVFRPMNILYSLQCPTVGREISSSE